MKDPDGCCPDPGCRAVLRWIRKPVGGSAHARLFPLPPLSSLPFLESKARQGGEVEGQEENLWAGGSDLTCLGRCQLCRQDSFSGADVGFLQMPPHHWAAPPCTRSGHAFLPSGPVHLPASPSGVRDTQPPSAGLRWLL